MVSSKSRHTAFPSGAKCEVFKHAQSLYVHSLIGFTYTYTLPFENSEPVSCGTTRTRSQITVTDTVFRGGFGIG